MCPIKPGILRLEMANPRKKPSHLDLHHGVCHFDVFGICSEVLGGNHDDKLERQWYFIHTFDSALTCSQLLGVLRRGVRIYSILEKYQAMLWTVWLSYQYQQNYY